MNFIIINFISKKINNASLLENDSWETIQSNIRSGNTDIYNIGETKKVIVDKFFLKGQKKGVPKSAHLEKLICYDNEWTTGL